MKAIAEAFGRHRGAGAVTMIPVLGLLLAAASSAGAQEAVVSVDENVRSEPNGTVIAELRAGTPVAVLERDGGWSRVTFGGVVWIPSLQARDGGTYDLIVISDEGENLRVEPSGRIVGRLNSGTLLEEVDRVPGWVRVQRTAWIWSESLEVSEGAPAETTAEASVWIRVPEGDAGALLAAPDGDTLARALPGAEVRVVQRDGPWVRVRIEGWLWQPDDGGTDPAEPEAILRGVSPGDIAEEPERFRGRVVEMELQFISLERAEAVRADFREGEPFLLTRSIEPDRAFAYVAVPPEELDRVSGLAPLDRIVIVGRVRTGAAALTGNPVLDLLEMQIRGRS